MLNLYELNKEEKKIAKKIFKIITKMHGLKSRKFSVDMTIVGSDAIHELNKATRDVDRATDVLSYPAIEAIDSVDQKQYVQYLSDITNNRENSLGVDPFVDSKNVYLGELIICREVMNAQAIEYGHAESRECAFLITHGLLHLLGYDHIESEEKAVMRAKEKEVLEIAKYFR